MSQPTIRDVNDLLKMVLQRELEPSITRNLLRISFEHPTRKWSSQINEPTLNLFLYELRKNKFRQAQWETRPDRNNRNRAIQQRAQLRLDLHYMITAWAPNADEHGHEDEYDLLTLALLALSRHPRLPDSPAAKAKNLLPPDSPYIQDEDLPERLRDQPSPIPLLVAEPDDFLNLTDVWSALDNDLRPAITCTVTLAVDPFKPISVEMVRRRELRTFQIPNTETIKQPKEERVDVWPGPDRTFYQLEGSIRSSAPLENMRLILVGRGLPERGRFVPLESSEDLTDHQFAVEQLGIGDYNLEISATDTAPIVYEFVIPDQSSIETEKEGITLKAKINQHTNGK